MVSSVSKMKLGEVNSAGNFSGATYHLRASRLEDYYSNDKGVEPAGEWYVGGLSLGPDANRECAGVSNGTRISTGEEAEKYKLLLRGIRADRDSSLIEPGSEQKTGVARKRDKFIETQNSDKADRICLFDLTYTTPKSLSVIWSQCDEDTRSKIEAAQHSAARAALDLFQERAAITRRGKDGVIRERAQLIAAMWEHGSSRAEDPLLHTHCTVINTCVRADGSVGTIETQKMFQYQGAAASLYHAELAYRVAQIGFQVEMGTGRNIFEVAGVPDEVMADFSRRSEAAVKTIRDRMEASAERSLQGLSDKEIKQFRGLMQQAVLESRTDKGEMTRSQLQAEWLKRGSDMGFSTDQVLALMQNTHNVLTVDEMNEMGNEAVAELMEFESVFTDAQLLTAVAVKLQGFGSGQDIREVVEHIKSNLLESHTPLRDSAFQAKRFAEKHALEEEAKKAAEKGGFTPEQLAMRQLSEPNLVGDTYYTTKGRLATEYRMLQDAKSINKGHVLDESRIQKTIDERNAEIRASVEARTFAKLVSEGVDSESAKQQAAEESASAGMSEEQVNALRWVAESDKAVSIVQGRAGAGKTFAMKSITDSYTAMGYSTVALAASHAASKKLAQECSLGDSQAITGFLNRIKSGDLELNGKSLIVLDEAGQVGTVQMAAVTEACRVSGAKLILSGDTRQQGSVTGGSAMAMLLADNNVGYVDLDNIRRQKSEAEREAIKQIFDHQSQSGKVLTEGAFKDRVSVVREGSDAVNEKMVADWKQWRESHAHLPKRDQTTLLVAQSRADVDDLNQRAHEACMERGEFQASQEFDLSVMGAKGPAVMKFAVGESVVMRTNEAQLKEVNPAQAQQAALARKEREKLLNQERELAKQEGRPFDPSVVENVERITNRTNARILAFEAEQPNVAKDATEEARAQAMEESRGHGLLRLQAMGADGAEGRIFTISTRDKAWHQIPDKAADKPKGQGKDDKAEKAAEPDSALAIQHTYAITTYSSQGQDVAASFVKDATGLDSKSAGVAMSRHRDDVHLYVDAMARYDSYTRFEALNDIKSYEEFTNEDCLARVESAWSKSNDKANARDFANWQPSGAAEGKVQPELVVQSVLASTQPREQADYPTDELGQRIVDHAGAPERAKERVQGRVQERANTEEQGRAEGSDRLDRLDRLERLPQLGGKSAPVAMPAQVTEIQERIERETAQGAAQGADAGKADRATRLLPVETTAGYALPKPADLSASDIEGVRRELQERGVSPGVIQDAEKVGFLGYARNEAGLPAAAYNGYSKHIDQADLSPASRAAGEGSEGSSKPPAETPADVHPQQGVVVNRLTEQAYKPVPLPEPLPEPLREPSADVSRNTQAGQGAELDQQAPAPTPEAVQAHEQATAKALVEDDRAFRNREATPEPGPMRHRYSPMLGAGPDGQPEPGGRMVVTNSGYDALMTWTQADAQREPRPSVVVIPDATKHQAVDAAEVIKAKAASPEVRAPKERAPEARAPEERATEAGATEARATQSSSSMPAPAPAQVKGAGVPTAASSSSQAPSASPDRTPPPDLGRAQAGEKNAPQPSQSTDQKAGRQGLTTVTRATAAPRQSEPSAAAPQASHQSIQAPLSAVRATDVDRAVNHAPVREALANSSAIHVYGGHEPARQAAVIDSIKGAVRAQSQAQTHTQSQGATASAMKAAKEGNAPQAARLTSSAPAPAAASSAASPAASRSTTPAASPAAASPAAASPATTSPASASPKPTTGPEAGAARPASEVPGSASGQAQAAAPASPQTTVSSREPSSSPTSTPQTVAKGRSTADQTGGQSGASPAEAVQGQAAGQQAPLTPQTTAPQQGAAPAQTQGTQVAQNDQGDQSRQAAASAQAASDRAQAHAQAASDAAAARASAQAERAAADAQAQRIEAQKRSAADAQERQRIADDNAQDAQHEAGVRANASGGNSSASDSLPSYQPGPSIIPESAPAVQEEPPQPSPEELRAMKERREYESYMTSRYARADYSAELRGDGAPTL